jgi:hypothetical protein
MMSEMNALNLGGTLLLVDSIGTLEKVSVNMASAMVVVVGGAAEGRIAE